MRQSTAGVRTFRSWIILRLFCRFVVELESDWLQAVQEIFNKI